MFVNKRIMDIMEHFKQSGYRGNRGAIFHLLEMMFHLGLRFITFGGFWALWTKYIQALFVSLKTCSTTISLCCNRD
jgi:hypothetical protein